MKLPEGWVEVALDDVASVRSEKANPSLLGSTPFIGLEHIEPHTGRLIAHGSATDVRSMVAKFKVGDVLYGRLRPYLNKVIEAPFDGCASAEIVPFTPHNGVSSALLRRVMMSAQFLEFTASLDKGDRPRVNAKEVGAYRFSLPPEAEQRRIIAKVDALAVRLARARTELHRVLNAAIKARQSILTAFLSAEGQPQQQTTANQFSSLVVRGAMHWQMKRLGEVCRIEGGSQPPKSTFTYEPGPGKVRLIQIRDYKSDKYATYIDKSLARRFCTADEVMVGRYGPPIFQILRGIEGAYNVALMKAVPTECVTNEFLYYLLQLPVLRQYVEQDADRTAGQDGVNKAHLLQFRCFIPPIEEQNFILQRIKAGLARVDGLEAQARRATALLDALEDTILARAFRGELVPQDPKDEPASMLLERIRAGRTAKPKTKRGRHRLPVDEGARA